MLAPSLGTKGGLFFLVTWGLVWLSRGLGDQQPPCRPPYTSKLQWKKPHFCGKTRSGLFSCLQQFKGMGRSAEGIVGSPDHLEIQSNLHSKLKNLLSQAAIWLWQRRFCFCPIPYGSSDRGSLCVCARMRARVWGDAPVWQLLIYTGLQPSSHCSFLTYSFSCFYVIVLVFAY